MNKELKKLVGITAYLQDIVYNTDDKEALRECLDEQEFIEEMERRRLALEVLIRFGLHEYLESEEKE